MTVPIAIKLRDYRQQLADWVRRKGMEGGGGPWDREKRKYNKMAEPPQPENLGTWEKKAFDAVRAAVIPKPDPNSSLRGAA